MGGRPRRLEWTFAQLWSCSVLQPQITRVHLGLVASLPHNGEHFFVSDNVLHDFESLSSPPLSGRV